MLYAQVVSMQSSCTPCTDLLHAHVYIRYIYIYIYMCVCAWGLVGGPASCSAPVVGIV
jgi:hypothetical protein